LNIIVNIKQKPEFVIQTVVISSSLGQ